LKIKDKKFLFTIEWGNLKELAERDEKQVGR
jgi:hypothetical protein